MRRKSFRVAAWPGIVLSLCFWLQACGFREPLPPYNYERNCYAVEVADGPEDFVFDKWSGSPRLLISSHERRQWALTGGIFYFDLKTGYSHEMKRVNEPRRIKAFRPHGMDILHQEGRTTLYVILHDPYDHGLREENAIGVYRVAGDSLVFVELLENPRHLWSPNDLSVLESGDLYVTNDYRWAIDLYLRRETSEVVYYRKETGAWRVAADDIAFANGILARPDRVFVAATRSDCIMSYPRTGDGRLGAGKKIMDIKGPDNIMPLGDYLVVSAHYNDWAFLGHSSDKEAIAPSVVVLINPYDAEPEKTMKTLYVDEGNQISAASTAFVVGGKLIISQVFNSKIVICDAADLAPIGEGK